MRKPRLYPAPRQHGPADDTGDLILNPAHARCGMCGRPLGIATDPLSTDCGGDCWGCIGEAEASGGDRESRTKVDLEIEAGIRNADGTAKPWG